MQQAPVVEQRGDGLFNVQMPSGSMWAGVDQQTKEWLTAVGSGPSLAELDAARERRAFAALWDAAHAENAKRDAKRAERERREAERVAAWEAAEAARYVPGTEYLLYAGAPTAEIAVVDWIERHMVCIKGKAKAAHFDRFAANLRHANGQEFTPLMDGFTELDPRVLGLCMEIHLNADLPVEFAETIMGSQKRFGIRADEPLTTNLRVVYCTEYAWELLRRGYFIG